MVKRNWKGTEDLSKNSVHGLCYAECTLAKKFSALNKAFHELMFKYCRLHLFYHHIIRLTTLLGLLLSWLCISSCAKGLCANVHFSAYGTILELFKKVGELARNWKGSRSNFG